MARLLPLIAFLTLSASLSAQTAKVRYHLDDVWLIPDISHPNYSAQQMTGAFEWTYQIGDFENGSAEMLWVDIPWFGTDMNKMIVTIDTGSLEISLNGNFHNLGLDVFLEFATDLEPNQSLALDLAGSHFTIENGISWKGHAESGTIAHDRQLTFDYSGPSTMPTFSVTGVTTHRPVALLWAWNPGSFVVPGGYRCAGTVLGLDASVQIGATLSADAFGQASLTTSIPPGAWGAIWLQALDLSSCGLSDPFLLI